MEGLGLEIQAACFEPLSAVPDHDSEMATSLIKYVAKENTISNICEWVILVLYIRIQVILIPWWDIVNYFPDLILLLRVNSDIHLSGAF